MSKSMYSLILSDDVVGAIDALARQRGTSRTALINGILAEYVSLSTPRQRVEDIFRAALEAARQQTTLQFPAAPTAGMLQVRSQLRYKYSPTIRYSVEIQPHQGVYSGWFRAVSRTQNEDLKELLHLFYRLWSRIEEHCLRRPPVWELGDGRYHRWIELADSGDIQDAQALGEAIGGYIRLFDAALELYFLGDIPSNTDLQQELTRRYTAWLKQSPIAL